MNWNQRLFSKPMNHPTMDSIFNRHNLHPSLSSCLEGIFIDYIKCLTNTIGHLGLFLLKVFFVSCVFKVKITAKKMEHVPKVRIYILHMSKNSNYFLLSINEIYHYCQINILSQDVLLDSCGFVLFATCKFLRLFNFNS